MSCLIGIIDVSRAQLIQPVLPELIGSLLMALSGVEPALFNQLQVRASGSTAEAESEME